MFLFYIDILFRLFIKKNKLLLNLALERLLILEIFKHFLQFFRASRKTSQDIPLGRVFADKPKR